MLNVDLTGRDRAPATASAPRVSWDEFHDNWDKEERRTEWVDGVLISVSPESIHHLLQTAFLAELVRSHVRPNKLGLVLTSNFIMRLRSRPSGRMPDVLFVANEHLDRVNDTFLDGPADLAIEVVSPESRGRDRAEKLAEYEAAGVPEYWIVDESPKEALFYVLDNAGTYQLTPPGTDGIYSSTVLPGLRIRPEWLWRWPLPDVEEALADLPA